MASGVDQLVKQDFIGTLVAAPPTRLAVKNMCGRAPPPSATVQTA